MVSHKCILIIFICGSIVVGQVHSGAILEKVKDGVKVVHKKIYCGLHKLKELIKHHDHDVDPCMKDSQTTTAEPPPTPPTTGRPPTPEEISKIIGKHRIFKVVCCQ